MFANHRILIILINISLHPTPTPIPHNNSGNRPFSCCTSCKERSPTCTCSSTSSKTAQNTRNSPPTPCRRSSFQSISPPTPSLSRISRTAGCTQHNNPCTPSRRSQSQHSSRPLARIRFRCSGSVYRCISCRLLLHLFQDNLTPPRPSCTCRSPVYSPRNTMYTFHLSPHMFGNPCLLICICLYLRSRPDLNTLCTPPPATPHTGSPLFTNLPQPHSSHLPSACIPHSTKYNVHSPC